MPRIILRTAVVMAVLWTIPAFAGADDTVERQKGLATAKAVPAKELFGNVKEPAPLSARAIGFTVWLPGGGRGAPGGRPGMASDAAVADPIGPIPP